MNNDNEGSKTNHGQSENVEQHVEPGCVKKPSLLFRLISNFWRGILARQIFQKSITLLFALAVFGTVYERMSSHREILSYMGSMLLMVLVYVEMLVVRDHLWVIEGSIRESRRWRDIFFSQANLRRQRLRKMFLVVFALGIFSYIYHNSPVQSKQTLSFFGIMLMMTVLYYEILTVRDEVSMMSQAIVDKSEEKDEKAELFEKIIDKELADDRDEQENKTK